MTRDQEILLIDQEARERAVNDLDSSFCMEAGAGTGKTTLLVGRYLSLIRTARAGCRQIVAITFTEKAAAEMKARLRRELGHALADSTPGSEEGAVFSQAIDEIEGAPISTIHAFASSLLREYPVEARVDPGFDLLDDIEGSILLDECWSTFLSSAGDSELEMLRDWYTAGGTSDRLRAMAMKLYNERGNAVLSGLFEDVYASDAMASATEKYGVDLEALSGKFTDADARLRALLDGSTVSPDDKGGARIRSFLAGLAILRTRSGKLSGEDVLTCPVPKGAGSMANWDPPGACREQKLILKELAIAQAEARTEIVTMMRAGLQRWLEGFLEVVEKRKRDEGLLDFDDLLIKARKLLDESNVLRSIRKRYKYFLVDEFQDTDPVQAEIVMLLSGGGKGRGDTLPDPGRLFIVGDPKQSIYRFRRADIEIYEKVKRKFGRSDLLLTISQNFRSLPGVTRWVNELFSGLITSPEGRYYQPDYEPVHAWRDGEDAAVISLEIEAEEKGADAFRRTEGKAVAGFITALLDSGREVMDPVTREARPVRSGDIALLYRGTTGIEHYEDSLRERNIPYIVEGGRLYYTRQEIRDIANAMWVVEDPGDALALVACLRSGFFGFSDEELLLFRADGGRFDYLDPGPADSGEHVDLQAAFKILARLHSERGSLGSARTLKALLRNTGYIESSLLQPHGKQRIDNIGKAVETARFFDRSHHSFRYFARWMRDQEKLGAAEGESPVIDGDEDAVRLLTVHKSKGLQFPVVIVVNLVQRVSSPGKLLTGPAGSLSFDLGDGWRTDDFQWVSNEEKLKDVAETVRLLYVASTRAGDLLVFPRGAEMKGHYEIISRGLEGVVGGETSEGSPIPRGGDPGDVLGMKASDLEETGAAGGRDGWQAAAGGTTIEDIAEMTEAWRKEKSEAMMLGLRAPSFFAPSTLSGHEDLPHPDGGAGSGKAMETGSVFHGLMETIDLEGGMDLAEIAAEAASRHGLAGISDELAVLLENTLNSSLVRRAATAKRIFREVSFSVPLSRAGGSGAESPDSKSLGMLEGRIDLLFEDDEGWTLVDYKTDRVPPGTEEERAEHYRDQGTAYALALEQTGITLDGGVHFLFARTGVSARLALGDEDISRLKDSLLDPAPGG